MKLGVFILSSGRPDKIKTLRALEKSKYDGEIKIIIDDLDETGAEYKKLYGDKVIVFNKREALKKCDTMDNFGKTNIVLPARNKCHEIAGDLGWDYFFELDDDYNEFYIRYPQGEHLTAFPIKNINPILEQMCRLLEDTNTLCVCFSQGGDYMGGVNGRYIHKRLSRKAMNCYVCKTDRPFEFIGTINEDTNMYVRENMRGNLVFSSTYVSCVQNETQQEKGGLTDIYLDIGTYIKSFYSVMVEPSCVKVSGMGVTNRRIHHNVRWNNCAPLILNEKYRKVDK